MAITQSDFAAVKGTEMIRMHEGNCKDAAEQADSLANQYQIERSYENAGFWADVARRIRKFAETIKLEA